jgi:macrolide-specific efflux system membrane fusion protein
MGKFFLYLKAHKKPFFIGVFVFIFIFIFGFRFLSRNSISSFVERVQRGNLIESVYGIGTVVSNKTFQFKVGVPTTIRSVFVKEGDYVKTRQKIVELEGVYSSAPFAGVVTFLPVKVGETIFAQSIVYVLSDLNDRYITVSLEQRGALKVRQGQKAKISFESLREKTFQGIVESVYSFENNFLVRIGVTELPTQILPGMTADVAIGIKEHKDKLVVPVAALTEGSLSLKRGGRKMTVDVKTGIVEGAFAEISSGDVKEGDELILPSKSK